MQRHNTQGHDSFQLSLSVGVQVYDASLDELSVEELVTRADKAMYEQKLDRKNYEAFSKGIS